MIKSLVVKLKFSDFTRTTAERTPGPVEGGGGIDQVMDAERYRELLAEAWDRGNGRAVRLIGLGVRFADPESKAQLQLEL